MVPGSNANDSGWFSRERLLIVVLGLATLLALYACYQIVAPFIPPIAIAVAAAVSTRGPQSWLRRHIRSNTAAAAIGVVLVACLIVVPLSVLLTYIVRQIVDGIQAMQAGGGVADWRSLFQRPPALARAVEWIESNLDLQAQLTRLGEALASRAGGLLAGTVSLVTQLFIMLFVLFFLYRDGRPVLEAVGHLVPLSEKEASRVFARIEDTILATVNGSLTVAFVQALLAGIMYMALGVPGSVIWASATFIFALVPVFGTFLIWGPIAIYLLLAGSWVKAVVLAGWGILAVGTIDNFLYPYLVGGRLRLHTVPTFFSIIGGIAVFGPAGIILGPLVLAVTIGLLDVWWWRTAGGRTAEKAVEAPDFPVSPLGTGSSSRSLGG